MDGCHPPSGHHISVRHHLSLGSGSVKKKGNQTVACSAAKTTIPTLPFRIPTPFRPPQFISCSDLNSHPCPTYLQSSQPSLCPSTRIPFPPPHLLRYPPSIPRLRALFCLRPIPLPFPIFTIPLSASCLRAHRRSTSCRVSHCSCRSRPSASLLQARRCRHGRSERRVCVAS